MTPDILKVEDFEVMRERFIEKFFIPYATKQLDAKAAQQIATGLRSPNETAAVLLDAMILFRQQEVRNDNHKALQHFSQTVTDSNMIDLIVSKFGLKRQVMEPADPNAFPPKSAVMESDESLLLRYSLAPFGLSTTGTRTGYEFHALTLGERPLISVEAISPTVVVQRFEFQDTQGIERPKNAAARMIQPNSGKVEVRILSFNGNGQASPELIKRTLDYLSRPDIGQASDEISVKSGEILNYDIDIDVTEISEPNKLVDKAAFDKALASYVATQHKLKGIIQLSRLKQIAHNHNAFEINIKSPKTDFVCHWYQAPFCTGITTSVRPAEF
ncbi:baseplate J/gp47 family protein [Vibrio harveyi]|uniref:baseplate J/gp47 family protein n=1 Tax=Vibrio harveyi TaxID=669 RepID=UPI00068204DF|nr:baseplate J/gp47 family protein [Vibrio harveyi]